VDDARRQWLRQGRFEETPDAGLPAGALFRLRLRNDVRVWGLRIHAPRRLVSPKTRWLLRNGHYEADEARLSAMALDPRYPLVEFGAGLGVISCLMNPLLDDPRRHVAVEMNDNILPITHRNRDQNGCGFKIRRGALAYDALSAGTRAPSAGVTERSPAWGLGDQYGGEVGGQDVPRVTLQGVLDAEGWDRANVVMDVEGMEIAMLENERAVLQDRVATLCVETHPDVSGAARVQEFLADLQRMGFQEVSRRGQVVALRRQGPRPASGR
jgi:FkbM family methyltransferase